MADPYAKEPKEAVAGYHADFQYVALFYLDSAHVRTFGGLDLTDIRQAIRSYILMGLADNVLRGRLQYRVIDRTGERETWFDPTLDPEEQGRRSEDWRRYGGYLNAGIRIEGGMGDKV